MKIYKITCKVNNKVYIGQTSESLRHRFCRHMGYQKNDHDTKFYRAVRKYGIENFYIEEICMGLNKEHLNQLEELYIKQYNSIQNGYNTALGKIGGDTLSQNPNLDKIRMKISKSKQGGRNPHATKIRCINIDDGTTTIYDCMMDCQKDLNIPRHDIISRRCRKIITKLYRNKYMFEYL